MTRQNVPLLTLCSAEEVVLPAGCSKHSDTFRAKNVDFLNVKPRGICENFERLNKHHTMKTRESGVTAPRLLTLM
jgi:hypothetical protein